MSATNDTPPLPPGASGQVIDVRGLPPPEPLLRTLEATTTLAPGESLTMVHDRNPTLLFPRLAERGLTFHTETDDNGLVRVIIHRPPAETAAATPPA